MNRDSINWSGMLPAVTTPFTADNAIDETAFADNLERLLGAGASGFIIGGCTGEFWALSHDERRRLATFSKEVVGDRGTIVVGVGSVTVDETVALARHAEDAGCDGALVVPPYFVALTEDEILWHYSQINARVGIPICLYNIPANAVNALTPDIVSRLADLDRVVAIKESSGDWKNFYGTLVATGDRIRVFCGPASVYGVPALQLGADGLMDCFPNVWTEEGIGMFELACNGPAEEARAVQAKGRALTELFVACGGSLYPATKAALDLMGLPGGGAPRSPLRPVEGDALIALKRGLEMHGLLQCQPMQGD